VQRWRGRGGGRQRARHCGSGARSEAEPGDVFAEDESVLAFAGDEFELGAVVEEQAVVVGGGDAGAFDGGAEEGTGEGAALGEEGGVGGGEVGGGVAFAGEDGEGGAGFFGEDGGVVEGGDVFGEGG